MSTILGVQNFGGLKIFDLKNFCRVNIWGSVLLRVNSFEGQKFSGIPFLVGSKFQGPKFFEVTILQGTNILGIKKLQGSKKYSFSRRNVGMTGVITPKHFQLTHLLAGSALDVHLSVCLSVCACVCNQLTKLFISFVLDEISY